MAGVLEISSLQCYNPQSSLNFGVGFSLLLAKFSIGSLNLDHDHIDGAEMCGANIINSKLKIATILGTL